MRHVAPSAFAAATPAPTSFDPTDVPRVAARHLALALRILIDNGHGLVLLRGVGDQERALLDEQFWRAFDGDTATGVATLLRFESLAAVFTSSRLRDRFLASGQALFPAALLAGAEMRLNANWGFNPQRTISALAEIDRARALDAGAGMSANALPRAA